MWDKTEKRFAKLFRCSITMFNFQESVHEVAWDAPFKSAVPEGINGFEGDAFLRGASGVIGPYGKKSPL
ncbi:hypothetical protein EYF80_039201 [Liparis tanakae]|uniref:Uncharacterized protein n=1 Tax=Liparis tanakae TaxID=230148 RepID=A0A4Z2GBH2_9TELE|nr:hypothetical protein EYF80_039201 [Liparis tanakae]